MGQEVADACDLPLSKLNELSEFLTELDAGRPGGEVHLTEQQDRIAEVANLLRPILEAFPSLAVELAPRLSRALMTSEDGSFPSRPGWIEGCHSMSASSSIKSASRSSAFHAATARLTVSTFSSDIAHAVSIDGVPLSMQSGSPLLVQSSSRLLPQPARLRGL